MKAERGLYRKSESSPPNRAAQETASRLQSGATEKPYPWHT